MIREARHPEPIIRPSLFRDIDFAVMNAASVAVHLAAFSVLLLVPYYLLRIAGLDVAVGGIVLAIGAGGTVVGSWLAGRLAARTRIGRLALAGVVLGIAGLWAVSAWTPATGLVVMGLSLLVQGVGVGLFQVAYADLVTATLPIADRGVAGSLITVTRTIGIVGGATGLSAAVRHFETAALSSRGERDGCLPRRLPIDLLLCRFGARALPGAEPVAPARLALGRLRRYAILSRS